MLILKGGKAVRIIVYSDTHGSFSAHAEIFQRNQNADAFIFLGDGERELDKIRALYPEKTILNVAGNCDYGSMTPSVDIFMANGVKILFTHGHTADIIPMRREFISLIPEVQDCRVISKGKAMPL